MSLKVAKLRIKKSGFPRSSRRTPSSHPCGVRMVKWRGNPGYANDAYPGLMFDHASGVNSPEGWKEVSPGWSVFCDTRGNSLVRKRIPKGCEDHLDSTACRAGRLPPWTISCWSASLRLLRPAVHRTHEPVGLLHVCLKIFSDQDLLQPEQCTGEGDSSMIHCYPESPRDFLISLAHKITAVNQFAISRRQFSQSRFHDSP